jgi:hypothetical protein
MIQNNFKFILFLFKIKKINIKKYNKNNSKKAGVLAKARNIKLQFLTKSGS